MDNIIVFGDGSAKLTKADLARVNSTPTTEFHILRHFSSVPEDYIQRLVGKEYDYYDHEKMAFVTSVVTKENIIAAFETKGSKFFSGIPGMETPDKVINLIKNKLEDMTEEGDVVWINRGETRTVCFTFSHQVEVGYAGLVDIGTLSNLERARVVQVSRGAAGENGIMIKTISGVSRVPIHTVAVELTDVKGRKDFSVTAYPGELSPDFPNPKQSEEECRYCKAYWDTHAFVE